MRRLGFLKFAERVDRGGGAVMLIFLFARDLLRNTPVTPRPYGVPVASWLSWRPAPDRTTRPGTSSDPYAAAYGSRSMSGHCRQAEGAGS